MSINANVIMLIADDLLLDEKSVSDHSFVYYSIRSLI